MTNLTEKWKKGELPSGWYYVKGSRAEGIYAYTAEYLNNMYRPRNGERIIEKAPSYEEYQKLLSDQLAKNEGVEINAELNERLKKTQKLELDLRRENTKLKTENKWYSEQLNEAVKENTKLKELLKEAEKVIWEVMDCREDREFYKNLADEYYTKRSKMK